MFFSQKQNPNFKNQDSKLNTAQILKDSDISSCALHACFWLSHTKSRSVMSHNHFTSHSHTEHWILGKRALVKYLTSIFTQKTLCSTYTHHIGICSPRITWQLLYPSHVWQGSTHVGAAHKHLRGEGWENGEHAREAEALCFQIWETLWPTCFKTINVLLF